MSYKLHCPDCSKAIPPENINVQQVIAACDNCGAVFNFAEKVPTAQRKAKRRKSKQPDYIEKTETVDGVKLEMPFLLSNGYKIGSIAGAVSMFLFYAFILAAVLPDNDPSDIVPMTLLGMIFVPFALSLISSLFAKQSIELDHDELKHEIRLANVPFYKRKMNASDVVDVSTDEMSVTRESTAEARYNIYAEKYDSRQDMFIQNQPEDMAMYTQQVLSAYLNPEDALADDVSSRLQDDMNTLDDDYLVDDNQMKQQKNM